MILSRDAGVRSLGQPTDGSRSQHQGVGSLLRRQSKEACRSTRRPEGRTHATVVAAIIKAGNDCLADPSRRFIPDDDGRQYIPARGPRRFAHRQRSRGQRRARMHDIAQITVVRCRRVTLQGIGARGTHDRQLRSAVEPHRRLRRSTPRAFDITDDPRRLDTTPARGAGDGAGNDHGRVVDGLVR